MNDKKIFIARAIAWSIFSAVLPVAFIGWRYSLFKKVGKIQLSGWGLFAVVIVFIFLITLVKYIKSGFQEWTMVKQIINGVLKIIIPLVVLLLLCITIRNNIDYFIQALSCVLLCEAIAIPINPFPEWVYIKSQGRMESMLDLFASKMQQTNKEEKVNAR